MTSLTTGAKNRTFSVCGFREILTVWSRNPVASRLVREGVELNHRIVVELAEAARYWPAAPLSLLALSGRASEAGDIAKRLNLLAFVDLIGPSTGIGVTP